MALSFRDWWPESARCAGLLREEQWEDDEVMRPHRLDEEALATFLTDFERHDLEQAGSGAWAMRRIDDDDPRPRCPGDRLVALLGRDLFGTVIQQVMDDPGDVRPLVCGIGVPFGAGPGDHGFSGCLLLVGPTRLGLVMIEATA
ncbi:hypothetical protein HII36_32500 [Nonomuraea sp. NN258]|uniref:hypothetical protein n=1 Tax=Nonomuraea antri TaxID=2730852 RepID=UPI00156A077D|nr:hypothetical protein [Nonomuraea antri]NRQ36519.1 hypothetical protein [Nonomuraea antri]